MLYVNGSKVKVLEVCFDGFRTKSGWLMWWNSFDSLDKFQAWLSTR